MKEKIICSKTDILAIISIICFIASIILLNNKNIIGLFLFIVVFILSCVIMKDEE